MIRTLLVTLGLGCTSAASFADTYRIEVAVPSELSNKAAVAEYTAALKKAVRSECARANSPLIGQNYDRFVVCVKAAELEVARQDKTGLFAAELGIDRRAQLALD